MKIIFKTLLLLFIISISTCNVYTLLYSGKQTFLSFNNIEALASNEYTSNVYEFHQITIECGNTSFLGASGVVKVRSKKFAIKMIVQE